ncbi:transporter substrate-binding domain-containing protein [Catenovulum maritimum]|uniref:Diguanylate cyclase n=1 Tax=Catenovulum maritimum TaxID=1513271 RepID=A0A0J8GZZ8_9ALTE|nr:transporter substrate-binding domain-containing protein [Catenovulum maritimum]KMT66804.1 diguanylate cyclase [Catenovulum maritimum]
MSVGFKSLFLLVCCLVLNTSYGYEQIRHNKISSAKEDYQFKMLKLALSYSDKQFTFQEQAQYLNQTKLLKELESGRIDVAWVGTSVDYEESCLPVRIPLFKGLLGHRIFLIKKGNQAKFDNIDNLAALSKLRAGQVTSWTDARILKKAGLNLVSTNKYNNLFHMLDGERFDYFPRSLYSPWSEMLNYPELDLEVEKSLMIVYPLPAYIFVNKENKALHQLILSGFMKAIEDGQFDKQFYNHPLIKEGLAKSQIDKRIILKVSNQEISPLTPLDDDRLWFDIEKFKQQNAM